jgi:hypothetical protein
MSISPVTAGAIVSTIAIGIANAILGLRCELLAKRYGQASFSNRRFRVSWRGYFLPVLCVALACFLLIDSRGTKYQGWFTFALACYAFLGGVYLAQANARSTVSIEGGIVKYIEAGRERWNISLEDILSVTTYQRNFHIRADGASTSRSYCRCTLPKCRSYWPCSDIFAL